MLLILLTFQNREGGKIKLAECLNVDKISVISGWRVASVSHFGCQRSNLQSGSVKSVNVNKAIQLAIKQSS